MAVPDPSTRLLPVDPGFVIQAGSAERIVKGEDRCFSHRAHPDMIGRRKLPGVGPDPEAWQLNYDVFCICDGHSGTAAANFVKQTLLLVLHPLMPEAVPTSFGSASGAAFAMKVRRAITVALVQLNSSFLVNKILSGCTVTVAIVTGALLTVANLGAWASAAALVTRVGFRTSRSSMRQRLCVPGVAASTDIVPTRLCSVQIHI